MAALSDVTVAVLEARLSGELAALVERHGGTPISVPAVREAPREAPGAAAFFDHLCEDRFRFVIFLTGVGVTALVREAERLGRLPAVLDALRRVETICRGPKPTAVLHRHRVPIRRTAGDPYTSAEVLATLETDDLREAGVAVVHYGEANAELTARLRERGARVEELQLYQWELPDDLGPLTALVGDLVGGRIGALLLTSQIQCRHLFAVAERAQLSEPLAEALNARVVVASIGPVTTKALLAYGVTPRVIPPSPKMAPLVAALADYFDLTRA